jgi:hypothetical protein
MPAKAKAYQLFFLTSIFGHTLAAERASYALKLRINFGIFIGVAIVVALVNDCDDSWSGRIRKRSQTRMALR